MKKGTGGQGRFPEEGKPWDEWQSTRQLRERGKCASHLLMLAVGMCVLGRF